MNEGLLGHTSTKLLHSVGVRFPTYDTHLNRTRIRLFGTVMWVGYGTIKITFVQNLSCNLWRTGKNAADISGNTRDADGWEWPNLVENGDLDIWIIQATSRHPSAAQTHHHQQVAQSRDRRRLCISRGLVFCRVSHTDGREGFPCLVT